MNHIDGVTWALLEAYFAARAKRIVEFVAISFTQLDDRAFRASAVAAVAFEAVAAGKAALGFVSGFRFAETADDFIKTAYCFFWLEVYLLLQRRVGAEPYLQLFDVDDGVVGLFVVRRAVQPGVDVAGGFFCRVR